METKIYAIYDRKALYYLPIFVAQTDADAERVFVGVVRDSDTPVAQYPAEFDLHRLGTLNLVTGYIEPEAPVGLLINGLVALTAAHRQALRYQTVLDTVDEEQPLPEAS